MVHDVKVPDHLKMLAFERILTEKVSTKVILPEIGLKLHRLGRILVYKNGASTLEIAIYSHERHYHHRNFIE